MRNKPVPEKKPHRSWLGSFASGSGISSGKRLVEAAQKVMKKAADKASATPQGLEAAVTGNLSSEDKDSDAGLLSKKKSRRFRPGTVALREIRKAQSNQGLSGASISRLDRIIRDIAADVVASSGAKGLVVRFQPSALAALRDCAETFETDLLRLGNTLSIHRGKMTLHKKDLDLASTLMLAPHVLHEEHGSSRALAGVLKVMRRTGSNVSTRNDKKIIEGRDVTLTEKGKCLRQFTQETAYDTVADPPGLDKEDKDEEEDEDEENPNPDDESDDEDMEDAEDE
jgi:histone H3/H4